MRDRRAAGDSLQCRGSRSGDYDPYASFSFTPAREDGKVHRKSQELLVAPVAPSMTVAKYDKVTTGMTDDRVMGIVNKDSCAVWYEGCPSCPSTSGWYIRYRCKASSGTGVGHFWFTDGTLEGKSQQGLI